MLQAWTLTSENGGNIQLAFESLHLEECDYEYNDYTYEYSDECTCYDYVEVSYGSHSDKFCGDRVPEAIISCGSSSMVIKFHSGSDITRAGFRAVWEEVSTSTPCPTRIESHNDYPNTNYPTNVDKVT